MTFVAKIRPVHFNPSEETGKMVAKSRLKRIFERQFTRVSSTEKVGCYEEEMSNRKDGGDEVELGSVCLARMVRNFMEDGAHKMRCNDSSDDEFDNCGCFGDLNILSLGDACENGKSLVSCVGVIERNLLADTARIVDQNKISKRKDDVFLKILTNGLSALGYNASICNSRWGKSSACPAGEYKYVDVISEGERLIVDIDFRSEFEIARPKKKYRTILQTLPAIFVGKADRLQKIITLVMDAAKRSLKKKGMPFPPWRKAEYVKAKWLSAYRRTTLTGKEAQELEDQLVISQKCKDLELQVTFGEKRSSIVLEDKVNCGYSLTNGFDKSDKTLVEAQTDGKKIELKKSSGVKITGGLACIIEH